MAIASSMIEPPDGGKPKILSVRTAARSRLFHIETVELRFANGNVREFERVAGSTEPGAVIIVPLSDSGSLLLVREYAVGLERYELHLPMGGEIADARTLAALFVARQALMRARRTTPA